MATPHPSTKTTHEILGHLHSVRSDALGRHFLGKNIGKHGYNLSDSALRHELGLLQITVQGAVILDVMQIFERDSQRHAQNSFSHAIACLPNSDKEWKGLRHAGRMHGLQCVAAVAVKAKLEKSIDRRRNRPSFKVLRTIRNQYLAHSQRNPKPFGTVTWNNILSLLRFADALQRYLALLVWDANLELGPWPNTTGHALAALLKKQPKQKR